MAKPKPQEEHARISLRLPKLKKSRADKIAKKRRISTQQLVEKAIDERLSYSEKFRDDIENIAERLQLPVSTVVTHMMQRRIASDEAFLKVFGPTGRVLSEFVFEDGQLLTGDKLRKRLEAQYIKMFKDFKSVINHPKGKQDIIINQEDFKRLMGF